MYRFNALKLGSRIGPTIIGRRTQLRFMSNEIDTDADYYQIFPKTFPDGAPPQSPFVVNNRALRKEYLKLQALNHPDLNNDLSGGNSSKSEESSSEINKAYEVLNDPLKRSQYLLNYNAHIDLTSDEATRKYEFADKETLMEILELHEELEDNATEDDIPQHKKENQYRIDASIDTLNRLYSQDQPDYDQIALETIRLKYWYNIRNALKDWQPGEPLNMTH